MSNVNTLCFDTDIIADNPIEAKDDISLRVFSAIVPQLFRFCSNTQSVKPGYFNNFKVNKLHTVYKFIVDPKYKSNLSGASISIKRLFQDQLNLPSSVSHRFKNIDDVQIRKNGLFEYGLKIILNKPDKFFVNKLIHPSIYIDQQLSQRGAYRDFGGPYIWQSKKNKCGTLKPRNPNSKVIKYRVINSPDESIVAYEKGIIDFTCPTLNSPKSFEYYTKHKDCRKYKTNTFAVLFPTSIKAFSSTFRNILCEIIDFNKVQSDVGPLLTHTNGFINTPLISHKSKASSKAFKVLENPISIAYDNFPPNSKIVNSIANQIMNTGIKVNLITDSFQRPNKNSDLRLIIIRTNYANEMETYKWILNTPCLVNDRELYKEWSKLVDLHDESTNHFQRTESLIKLNLLAQEKSPYFLLGCLNQIGLCRENLNWFDWASCSSWERQ